MKLRTIEIDENSGFCFGVVKAISRAEELMATGKEIYSLGDIVHNRVEVQRLERSGLKTVHHDKLSCLKDVTMLIRAHGEPPATYTYAAAHGIRVVDATCPVVAKLQKIIAEAYRKMKECNGQVVLLGKVGHAEVIGLIGQVAGDVTVIESITDLDKVDLSRPIYLLSQTTQSLQLFNQIAQYLRSNAADADMVTVHDTICRQVANREPHLKEFAARYDIVIFVSGRKSSNGKVLFEICRGVNPRSYSVEDENEIDPRWFAGCESVGICGATSTPRWLMRKVADAIERM